MTDCNWLFVIFIWTHHFFSTYLNLPHQSCDKVVTQECGLKFLFIYFLVYSLYISNAIHYNYSIERMRNIYIYIYTTLEEYYYRIKVEIECVFLFFLNSKTKYTFQTPTINHIIYKIHESTTSDFNIKIVIVVATQ